MKLLGSIDDLEGKVIKSAEHIDGEEVAVLIFTDDTCAFFAVSNGYDGDHEIYLDVAVGDYIKLQAGVITEDEYAHKLAEQELDRAAILRGRELRILEELKNKYEPGQ